MTRKRKKASQNYLLNPNAVSGKRRQKRAKVRQVGNRHQKHFEPIMGVCDACHIRYGVLRSDGLQRCTLCQILSRAE